MFALFYSSLRFTEGGREGGTDLPIQNYMDIDEISIRKQNLSRNEASPSRFTGGGARGWVPIEGARIFQFLKAKEQKSPPREDFTPSKRSSGRRPFEARRVFRPLRRST